MKLTLLLILGFCMCCTQTAAGKISIIPEPYQTIEKTGRFNFNASTKVIIADNNEEILKTVTAFIKQFKIASGIQLQIVKQQQGWDTLNTLKIEVKDDAGIKNTEGYILDILPGKIKIIARAPAGVFYAFESLQQLLSPRFYAQKKVAKLWSIPCAYILDFPQFSYRSMMLDVSRHFFSTAYIKRYLDILSHYKINTFHWHLTDSHGWRLQIKQYPKLTSIGAWRADRKGIPMTIAEATQPNEPTTYGGFYTQEDVKEIIRYAKDRFITIIPEIEIPGHCTAALVAYPQYADLNNKTPLLIPCGYPGDLKHNFCVGYDSTYIFLKNVLNEVMDLFPSTYIHIGGDEVRGEPWLNCPRCQKLMQQKNFSTARQLQAYFTQQIDGIVTAHHKKIIGWEEVLGENISPQSVGIAWHGNEGAVTAVKKDYDVVMAPYRYTYFDFYQSDPRLEKYLSYFHLYLDTVYAFNPSPPGLNDAELKHILGGEACLWTENVETPQRVEYMTLPRLFALAEVLWSPSSVKNYRSFINKAETEFTRLDVQHVNYSTSLYNVAIMPEFNKAKKSISVALHDQAAGKYAIHYTTNGSNPTPASPVYHGPITVNKSLHVKTALVDKNRILGKINEDAFNINKATGSRVTVSPASADEEATKSYERLIDGICGTVEPYDGRWVPFHDSRLSITLDLQKADTIHGIHFTCMEDQVGNIFLPQTLKISISTDGINYKNVQFVHNKKIPQQLLRHTVNYTVKNLAQKARYVKIDLKNADIFKSEPEKNLLFIDEIVVQ